MSGLQLCFYLLGNTNWEQCYDGRARKPHLSSSSGSFPPGISKMESLAVWYPDINSNIHQYDLQALGQKINKKVFLASDLSCNNCLEPALLCIVLQVICTSLCTCNVTFAASPAPSAFLCRNPVEHVAWHQARGHRVVPEQNSYLVIYWTAAEWTCVCSRLPF